MANGAADDLEKAGPEAKILKGQSRKIMKHQRTLKFKDTNSEIQINLISRCF